MTMTWASSQTPKVTLQYVDVDAAVMIADTGCQRQVAGSMWHTRRCREIEPLRAMPFNEFCKFSFGPNAGVHSQRRLAYPAGLGGGLVVLGITKVSVNAPALFSRPAFEILGAVPDLSKAVMYYKALNTGFCLSAVIWQFALMSGQTMFFIGLNFPVMSTCLMLSITSACTSSGHFTAHRTAAMAGLHEPPDGVHLLHDQADGGLLHVRDHATNPERPNSLTVVSSPDRRNHAELHGSSSDEEQ